MERSKLLREEGQEISEGFRFLDLLGRYGEVRLVGSLALDLVVKPDIDFHLLVDQNQVLEVTKSILAELIADKRISEVRISDYLEKESLKIGIDKLPGRSADWSVDIWVTSDPGTTGFEELEKIRTLLTDGKRETILEIKRHYYHKGQLRAGLSSLIYTAVLKESITNLTEFKEYFEQVGPPV